VAQERMQEMSKENERLTSIQEKLEEKIDLLSTMLQYPPKAPKSQQLLPTGE